MAASFRYAVGRGPRKRATTTSPLRTDRGRGPGLGGHQDIRPPSLKRRRHLLAFPSPFPLFKHSGAEGTLDASHPLLGARPGVARGASSSACTEPRGVVGYAR
jgi:hypothetical protein